MMKRATWFVSGALAGAAGSTYVRRRVRATLRRSRVLRPLEAVQRAGRHLGDRAHDVADAVREGRAAMQATEAELTARRDAGAAPAGQVIVLHPGRGDVEPDHPVMRAARPRRTR